MPHFLDDPQTRAALDAQDMLSRIEEFREQCEHGEQIARSFSFPSIGEIQNIVICGMGGSAIGGDLIRAYAAPHASVPIEVVRNYSLPRYIGSDTLVIVSSYSGNTEESISAYGQAQKRGARVLGITTGGQLCQSMSEHGEACIQIQQGHPPRAALGYSFMSLLIAFETMGLIPNQEEELQELYAVLETVIRQNSFDVPLEENPAKRLALQLHGKFPIIYAGQDSFQPVAVRWKGQFNENAKTLAHDAVIPEMNHNEILGWSHPAAFIKECRVLYLLDAGYHEQTLRRFQVMKNLIEPASAGVIEIHSLGVNLLARLFSLISLGDFVSVYLAFLNGVDPTPMKAIEDLKEALKK